jgi:hypothetical protein
MKLQIGVFSGTGAWVLALAASACGGSEGGVPIESSVIRVALTAASTDERAVAVRSDDAALSIEELGLSLHALEIVPCAADNASLSVEDYPVELTAEPAAQAGFETGVEDYCALRIAVQPSLEDDPPELRNIAVFVRGTRADDTPFELRSTIDVDLELSSDAAFDTEHLALGFDLATWFAGAGIDDAEVIDGVVIVDEHTNSDVLEAFEANTAFAAGLYVDADRDGVLDADELDAIATAD